MYDPDIVRGWIAKAEAEVSALSDEAEKIQQRLAEARRQLMLLYEMLAAITNTPVQISPEQFAIGRSIREQVQENAETILREHGKPMHAQQIHAEFIRRGMSLPGRGTPTNIVAHLVASNRISRPGRGMYGLAEWDRPSHPAEASPSATSGAAEVADNLPARA